MKKDSAEKGVCSKKSSTSLENGSPLKPAEQLKGNEGHISSGCFYDILGIDLLLAKQKRNMEDERNAHSLPSLATAYPLYLHCVFDTGELLLFSFSCSKSQFSSVLYLNVTFKGFRVTRDGKLRIHMYTYILRSAPKQCLLFYDVGTRQQRWILVVWQERQKLPSSVLLHFLSVH